MNSLKKVLNFIVQSNIWVALSAGALTKITLLKFKTESNFIPLFVICASVLAYNYIRINELKEARLNWYRVWFDENKSLFIVVNILAGLGILVCWIFIPVKWVSLLVLIPFLILTFLYVKPTVFDNNILSLRSVPFLKMMSIALSWAGVTVLFPIMQETGSLNELAWIEFFERFLFVFALTIPFDIRDVNIDSEQMHTIPQVIGGKWSKWLAILFLVLVLILEHQYFAFWHFEANKTYVLFAYLSVLILNSTPKRSRWYTSFWVEGVPILWLLLILYF